MAAIINTNIQSLNAQRSLSSSQSQLATSMQRLSSGLRINSAKDDAAGLAIAERMTTQVRGLTVAMRNANDGISLAQTAEGALSSVGSNLQRIRELAVQSRNATNSDEDRAALDAEVQQLKAEISRIARDTSFNGTKLLDGSFTNMAFQVGANQGQTIDVNSIADSRIDKLGTWNSVPTPSKSVAVGTIAGGAATGDTGDYTYELTVDSVAFFSKTVLDTKTADPLVTGQELDAQWAAFAATSAGQGYKLSGTFSAGTAVISKLDGTDLKIEVKETGATTAKTAPTYGSAGFVGTFSNGKVTQSKTGFEDLSVKDTQNSDNAIVAMDAALRAINGARADLGAIQSRFETTVENLSVNTENLSASRSRIMDADFAAETANLSRTQILQQAGTAMVAQANQLPQQVLKLLQG
ncbi:flagellin [Comamonas thiooxydans]|uniref:flagellin N-terminal helical domain-containing protein n=1 Tax=Comamonas thiooxydans TaxID=363952 RepID=UPI0001BB0D16|nr:flagellin [Comamonas thiooxydans]ACY31197.1 flagellin-like protein [Comamonas thiooxydans]MDO1474943.1 flagellin [Comamonas thiooxydans]